MIKVRFAPSPTGNLHIGGARTALFNWLYAKVNKGRFVLRIEDTDKARSKEEYLSEILDSLKWLGFDWDELYHQGDRFDIYKEHAERLLKEDKAYIEESAEGRKAVIFKVHPQKIRVNDLIRGEIEFDTEVIKDQVLIKSDGSPAYNFACVVDDALMGITQVIRGDDHISNTPKQALLYQALGFKIPEFAHLPLIMNKEAGGRLSKRTGATAISDYRKAGYLPSALVNYLLLLSWSPGADREVIDIQEAVRLFNIRNVNKTAASFDLQKLDWMNNQYLKKEDPGKLIDLIIPFLIKNNLIPAEGFDREYILSVIRLFQARLSKLSDFAEWADFFFLKDARMDPEAEKKFLSGDLSREFRLFAERLERLDQFNVLTIEECFRQLVKDLNIQARDLIHPVRVALTGKTIGPGLFEIICYLGIERTKQRLIKQAERR